MKRRWKIAGRVLAAGLALLAVPVGALVSAFVGLQPLEPGRTFADGRIETIVDGYVACFLVRLGNDRFVLIDGCNDPSGAPVEQALAKHGAGLDAIEAVVLTHAHPDHVGLLFAHPELPVVALATEVAQLDGTGAFHGPLLAAMGAPPDLGLAGVRPVRDGATLSFDDVAIEVFAVPGHTAGSAAFLVSGVLFLGDNAAWKPPSLVGAPWIFSDDCDQNVASLRALAVRLADRRVDWLVPAHSAPAPGLAPLRAL